MTTDAQIALRSLLPPAATPGSKRRPGRQYARPAPTTRVIGILQCNDAGNRDTGPGTHGQDVK